MNDIHLNTLSVHDTPAHTRCQTLLVGIDGGGTKTEAAIGRRLANGEIEVLGRGSAGPTNLHLVSAPDAWQECRLAIDLAFAAAGLAPQPLTEIALAMAGGGVDSFCDGLAEEVVRAAGPIRVIVTHDARGLVIGGTPAGHGIALIAGTGSFAFARTAEGKEDRCGGWGWLLGDEGSAYAVAGAALRAAVAAHDGRGEPTELLPALQRWAGENDVALWPSRLQPWSRGQIADGATIVCEVAAAGDAVATRLLDEAAAELAKHLTTLRQRQFADEPVDLAFTGGLLVGCEMLRERLLERFESAGGRVASVRVIEHPADAAIQLLVEQRC